MEATEQIVYKRNIADVDWAVLNADLSADHFNNGRTPAQLRMSFTNCYTRVFAVCAGDGRIVGKARAMSDGVCNGYIVDVWTKAEYRRRGIARQMIELLLSDLPGQHIYLDADADVSLFYEKLGFEREAWGMSRLVGRWLQNDSRNAVL